MGPIILRASNGFAYNVTQQGLITTSQAPTPSGKWQLTGAVELGRGFTSGRGIKAYTLDDILNNRVPWFYKNGKQRCFVQDFDHGAHRVWMSPPLRSVWIRQHGYAQGKV